MKRRIDNSAYRSVLITSELSRRNPVPKDPERINAALVGLSRHISDRDPSALMRELVEVALNECEAGSAGLSVLRRDGDGQLRFHWDALSGPYSRFIGGTTPREHSPCGVTLDRGTPQLFSYPEQVFEYFRGVEPPLVEGLVLPLYFADGGAYGSLWIASHSEARKFDSEDARVMQSLCSFSMAAIRILDIHEDSLAA